jgi:hypothetical protein
MRARLIALALVMAPSVASAGKLKVQFLGDAALGVSIPVGDSTYNKFADPTFKFSVRAGAEIWLTDRIGIAPELTVDFIPVKTDDSTYRPNTFVQADTPFSRYRVLAGARLLINFGIGAAFARFGLGVDYLTGYEQGSGFGATVRLNRSSTAFTGEPGFGVQFKVLKICMVGATVGFPIAAHDFGSADPFNIRSFTAVDADLLGFFGVRVP